MQVPAATGQTVVGQTAVGQIATEQQAADLAAIDRLTTMFFAAFTSGATTALDEMPELFLPQALIVRTCGDPICYTVAEFIEPRRRLLNDGSLLEFSEWETDGHTELYGDIAHRFGGYAKSGVQNGNAFEGSGKKSIQFVRTADGWRISAVAWDDER